MEKRENNMTPDLAEYQRQLYELLYSDSDEIFANYSQDHAQIIIRAFLDAAENTIAFLSGDFGSGIYRKGDIHDAVVNAVRRGVNVRVISLGHEDGSNECLKQLAQQLDNAADNSVKGRFDYRMGAVRPGAQVQHFMVVDGKRYRIEEAHEMPAPDSVHAEVCCNGKAKAALLSNMFNAVWNRL